MYVYKEIYYRELVHMIMEADKPQDLQNELASWRPRREDGVMVQFHLKASRLQTQEELMF